MRELNEHHSFTGMQKDLVCSKHPVNFLYDARNIRLTSRGDSTMLAITNEKGTKFATDVRGVYVGHACISKYLVLFTSSEGGSSDRIYRIDLTNMDKEELYKGRLNFSSEYPITTLPFFESERIQKVYWVDGLNQPRLINIVSDNIRENIDTQFDFVRELALQEQVFITKIETGGYFPSGVIQYAFTYVNKYAQESNIFYISPLFYISPSNRGAAPDESVPCSFSVQIKNTDPNFNIIRMYSIERTSIDGTAITKRVRTIEYRSELKKNVVIQNSVGAAAHSNTESDIVRYTQTGMFDGEIQEYYILYKRDNPEMYISTQYDGYITWGPNSTDSSYVKMSKSVSFDTIKGYRYVIEGSEELLVTGYNPTSGITALDTGTVGDTIDPTELLYKGVNSLIVGSIAQKDNTLFLGNLKIEDNCLLSDALKNRIKSSTTISNDSEYIRFHPYKYEAHSDSQNISRNGHQGVSYAGFKHGETYRLGVQLQYKNGAWSDPIFIKDLEEKKRPEDFYIPTFKGTFSKLVTNPLLDAGFRKVRAVVVFPKENERTVLFQCVSSSTVEQTDDKVLSSWYFRHYGPLEDLDGKNRYIPKSSIRKFNSYLSSTAGIEIECALKNPFIVNRSMQTLHSPDIEFDDSVANTYQNVKCLYVGRAILEHNYSTINIQTSSGTISPNASGANNISWGDSEGYGIGTGEYIDYIVDDDGEDKFNAYGGQNKPYIFDVYLWNKSGSLNNDTTREAGKGTQSAVLKKKVFSNNRFYSTKYIGSTNSSITNNSYWTTAKLDLFNSDQLSIVKVDNNTIYQGNVDTVLSPEKNVGKYCSRDYLYYIANENEETNSRHGIWTQYSDGWRLSDGNIGDYSAGLVGNRNIVRMKYKSTPHLIGNLKPWFYITGDTRNSLPIIDVINNNVNSSIRFGGNSEHDLLNNQWLPCGEPVALKRDTATVFNYSYGDTYFGNWDCLKTYAFTPEDENQCVEIGCFKLESRVNPCGRYDRNTDQQDNTMMSPVNFNLMNMVYSQKDNFFTYRILDKDYYKNSNYPNQITWSEEKQAGNDVDNWTKITLVSTYDMDGTKGKINYMTTFKDQIFIFQDKAISNLLFNSRVQIPTSDGTPIEITNNYKVEGHRTLSDGVGCNNKDLVKQTPNSIYFIDSISNHLFTISDSLQDLSATHYMTSWFNGTSIDKLLYDNINHDLYVVNSNGALCFSELLGQFVSFYDYDHIKLIETYDNRVFTLRQGRSPEEQFLWYMFEGHYNSFFEYEYEVAPGITLNTGSHKSWYLTFISNGIDAQTVDLDKIFTNIDYRMDFTDNDSHSPNLTFDYMQVTDEYQNTGVVEVKRLKYQNLPNSFHHKEANTQKKFRIWRIQIPRALTWKTDRITGKRKEVQSNDRIRNPWCKITLGNYGKDNTKALLHDINVQYYI